MVIQMELDKRYDEMDKMMMELSHKAWESLMIDILKKDLDNRPGTTMKDAAKVVNDHAMKMWEYMDKGQKIPDSEMKKFHEDLHKAWKK